MALQIPHVAALVVLDMMEALGTAEVSFKGEISGNLSLHDPVHQRLEPVRVILERRNPVVLGTCFPIAEAAKLQARSYPYIRGEPTELQEKFQRK